MVLAGLWHGASWTFGLWGAFHGACIALGHRRRARAPRPRSRLRHAVAVLVTFHAVTLGWILFRAGDLATSWRVLSGPFAAPWTDPAAFLTRNAYSLALLAIFLASHRFDTHALLRLAAGRARGALLWPVVGVIWALAIAVDTGGSAKFIYFDF
jgi:alginate O-acetyltransferase complex protein AlgI